MRTRTTPREYWQFISKDGVSDQCFLFTDAFGRLLQLLLAVATILILYIKRKLESPARPIKVWAMDVGKQCVGSMLCHWLNIIFSIVFVASAATNDDECGVYFLTYLVDGTLGLVLTILFIRGVRTCAIKYKVVDLVDSGYYGEPPRWRVWWKQLGGYLFALLMMKIVDFLLMWALYTPLVSASNALFAGFASHRHFELVLVMIILPGAYNSFHFWILDSQIKCSGDHWKYHGQPGTSGEKHHMCPGTAPPIFSSSSLSRGGGAVFGFGGVPPSSGAEQSEPNLAIPL